MGQFLAIGLVTKCVTSKQNMLKNKISKDELKIKMESDFYFNYSVFDIIETDDNYIFALKSSILEEQLLPFLRKFYTNVYLNKLNYCTDIINKLSQTPINEWIAIAESKEYEVFQLDEYGTNDYLYFENPSKGRLSISYTSILLSMEGKIGMEEYGRQFNFFKYCIQQTFSEFAIAKALRVYITG